MKMLLYDLNTICWHAPPSIYYYEPEKYHQKMTQKIADSRGNDYNAPFFWHFLGPETDRENAK